MHPDDGVAAPFRRCIYGSESVVEVVSNAPGSNAITSAGQFIKVDYQCAHGVLAEQCVEALVPLVKEALGPVGKAAVGE